MRPAALLSEFGLRGRLGRTAGPGLPAGLKVDQAFLDRELWRRQQGYGRGGRMKIERDAAHILSGVRHGMTIGSPIAVQLENRDWKNWQEALPVEVRDEVYRMLREVVL